MLVYMPKEWFVLILNVAALLISTQGTTDPGDVTGLTILYSSWKSPQQLRGWNANGGDPCGAAWEGIECIGSRVTSLKLPGKNLGGSLGYAMDKLSNLKIMDLSNNQIGLDIPYQLPPQLQELYLSNNQFTGLPYSLKDLTSLNKLSVSHNLIAGSIPDVFTSLKNLNSLDMSDNRLTGTLPSTFTNLIEISSMQLQNNQLTGVIDVLAQLPLRDLNIENNQFTGWVPATLRSIPNLRDGGNKFSTSPAPPPPPFTPPPKPPRRSPTKNPSPTKSKANEEKTFWTGGKVAGLIIATFLAALALGLLLFFIVRRQRKFKADIEKKDRSSDSWSAVHSALIKEKPEQKIKTSPQEKVLKPPPLEKHKPPPPPQRSPINKPHKSKLSIAATSYSVADLQVATNSFAQENLLGEGSVGRVYRAELADGTLLAVKKLDSSALSIQNDEELLRVVSKIARYRHANVTELVGYCAEYGQKLLVYQYFSRGTLFDVLHSDDSKRLSWNQRVKIALGAARALEYLHEVCSPAVVHRNFKAANILLDDEWSPHVSDCGLAALTLTGAERQDAPQAMDSFGYSAPEYGMSGAYTVKSDVYSFGVVMLELLTGRKPLDSKRGRAEQSLVRWATPQLHDIDSLAKMVDPALQGIYPAKSLSRFADVISSCVQPEPEFRPPMSEVVQSFVRLMQRASLSKRSSGDELGASQRSIDLMDHHPF